MSKLVDDYYNKRINNLNSLYNSYVSIINKNYNNELRSISTRRLLFNQKKLLINEINKKYDKLKNKLKSEFDKEINNVLKSQQQYKEQLLLLSQNQLNNQTYNKMALLIGINYIDTSNELSGCINDAESIETYLKNKNFNIKKMTDLTDVKPTKENIMNSLKESLQNLNKGDLLFVYYSGHGSYTFDSNGNEVDGRDELIIPLDFNYIVDDELKSIINTYAKPDTNIVALFDCCNSGTALDLKYQMLEKLNYDDITENQLESETPCNILYLSGCKDNEYSLETYINNKVQGLMTWAFLEIMNNNNNNITWRNLLKKMRENLKSKTYQIPQLSSGKLFNPDNAVLL